MAAIVASSSQPPMIEKVAGLQVKKTHNVKHVAFTNISNPAKRASNEIHADGELRTNMCATCFGAIAGYALDGRTVGRGSTKFNEYVCCMTHPSFGVAGTQCGRCIGLGRGGECLDIPEYLQEEARPIIRMVPKFNAVLQSNSDIAYDTYPAGDKIVIDAILDLAVPFNKRLMAHKRNVIAPTKKRKASGDLNPSSEMADVVMSLKDVRSDINSLSKQVSALAGDVACLLRTAQRAERIQLQSQARERWLVEAVTKLGGAFASIPAFDAEDSAED